MYELVNLNLAICGGGGSRTHCY